MANHTRKFTDAQRKAIADDIRENAGGPGGSYRAIAKRNGCSVATVQKIADENGLRDRWQEGQAQTAATSVKQSNAAERRARLQHELLDDVDERAGPPVLYARLRPIAEHVFLGVADVERQGPPSLQALRPA